MSVFSLREHSSLYSSDPLLRTWDIMDIIKINREELLEMYEMN